MKKYISTTLPYINSVPHIGHAFEFVIADVISTYLKNIGNCDVFFNVGVDEHGQKVAERAEEQGYGEAIQAYCDKMYWQWYFFCQKLNINYDNFYRTTSEEHKRKTRSFFRLTDDRSVYNNNANYYEADYEVDYCVGCESPINKSEQLNGKCPIHNTTLKKIKEKNTFFRLSKYSEKVQNILIDNKLTRELENVISNMGDISITRRKENVSWGVSMDNEQVFYVWYEALLNYLFALGYPENESAIDYWRNGVIICGKDNLRFQAYILQALMLSNNLPQNSGVLVHGTILDENGRKMSKSVGNVINPLEQIEKYGSDALRYYLAFGLNTFSDSKYNEKELIDMWNNDIVNNLGNTISRVLHMIHKFEVDVSDVEQLGDSLIECAFENYDFKGVRMVMNDTISEISKAINEKKPWQKDFNNRDYFLRRIYQKLYSLVPYYKIILKNHAQDLEQAFIDNKKVILFKKIDEK